MLGISLKCPTAFAVQQDPTTHRFVWGDDLNSDTAGVGGNQTTYSTIKATHLSDIKQAIDLAKTSCGVVTNVWANQDTQVISRIGYPGAPLPSTHINTLRRAIEALYLGKYPGGVPSSSTYFTGSVNAGDRISRTDINNMRRALDDFAATCGAAPPVCGNGTCESGETSATCPADCPACVANGTYTNNDGPVCNLPFTPVVAPNSDCCSGWARTECPASGDMRQFRCQAAPAPVCGNGVVESGEQCDDNNTVNGDGCSSTCQTESSCLPDGTVTRTMPLSDPPVMLTQNDNGQCCATFEQCIDHSCVCGYASGGPGLGCGPTECDSSDIGLTSGGICGCNPNGATLQTIGFGCRRYRCNNGVWNDIGSGGLCRWAAECN